MRHSLPCIKTLLFDLNAYSCTSWHKLYQTLLWSQRHHRTIIMMGSARRISCCFHLVAIPDRRRLRARAIFRFRNVNIAPRVPPIIPNIIAGMKAKRLTAMPFWTWTIKKNYNLKSNAIMILWTEKLLDKQTLLNLHQFQYTCTLKNLKTTSLIK